MNEPTLTYKDPSQSIDLRVDDLLARMTMEEKIGQMTQVEKNSVKLEEIGKFFVGSVLSGGGGSPPENTVEGWAEMVDSFQRAALGTRLGIPIIYGVDAVHGHTNLRGATVFPHNIGLGAANDPDLMFAIGQATAVEMLATGIPWNFAPAVSIPQDIRWGRTFEGYGEDTDLVTRLAIPYLQGLQTPPEGWPKDEILVLGTPKHYLGDGGTVFGSSTTVIEQQRYLLDQGDTRMGEETLRTLFLPPYEAAIEAGALSIMASFNSWHGEKLHAHPYLLTEVLKGELGFGGFIISDWEAVNQVSDDYYTAVVESINAGIDMVMTPYDYQAFIVALTRGVEEGRVSTLRIDDAVRRILKAKFSVGLFESPLSNPTLKEVVGSKDHRELARQAVRKSLVLLKNENQTIPIEKETPLIIVAGEGADNIGLQSGGWTIEWMGKSGPITPGTTILEGIRTAVSPDAIVNYESSGRFERNVGENGKPMIADVGIVVISEEPYVEGFGDRANLTLSGEDVDLIARVRKHCQKLIVIIISGRPLVLTDQLPLMDALVAAWLPGSEGAGVADMLFGDYPFNGRLPFTWLRTNDQLPLNINNSKSDQSLFSFGFGLET
ncbi:MAG: glycoside hydrolase family 3 protein [Anaerolineales bacterium]|uniref:beta-glucosidase n=1 Tax=Candidatus Desulfolinea nitratireducens TaxID=2841698 RepID=A0A8J6NLA3_9CHLR|nr:glycoside hydrolase family 3 protein [Candidatus Desulfolinea nitratireducens]MBL6959947.1 glycoside hydrolase family 3 protein [Anaerolineales bacterium]